MSEETGRIEHMVDLIGRESEIRVIHTALTAVRTGRGASLIISGEAGIGKTRFAAEVADLARIRGSSC